ncbi:MAG: hypothetical protein NT108_01890, partial [Candidatus Kaiserbacteria bacterium]|nr:hypothetical protein [Candidatus Kaiserbacteria bacterium]
MGKTMSPSVNSITPGQIGKIQEILGAALRKSGLQSEPTQQVVEHQGDALVSEMVAVVRKRVEAISGMIVRHVIVNRTRTPQEAIDATGCTQYIDKNVLATMPQGKGDEVDVHFVPTKRFIPVNEVPAFLAQYGLVPDPRAQAAVNEADPAFAGEYPNGTQWGDNC